jgi:drug/metabolite transporter superfamily protein YnfA
MDSTSIRSAVARHPVVVPLLPSVAMALLWGIFLVVLGMKEGGDKREWLRRNIVLALFWIMTPQVVLAYVCVVLNAKYLGVYIAGCLVYMTVATAIAGLKLGEWSGSSAPWHKRLHSSFRL